MLKIRTYLMYVAAIFLPLFFVPLGFGPSSFSLELNFLGVILLMLVATTYTAQILGNRWVLYGLVAPWFVTLVLLAGAHVFLGPRASLSAFLPQIVFLIAALGMGFCLRDWLSDHAGNKRIMWFCTIIVFSFFAFLLTRAAPAHVTGLLKAVANFQPTTIIYYTRRVFEPQNFAGETPLLLLVNQHNRIAQHVFAHGFLVQALVLFVHRLGLKWTLLSRVIWAASLAMMLFAVLLLSGQSLASALITFLVCVTGLLIFRLSYSLLLSMALSTLPVIVIFGVLSQTEFFNTWSARFTSGNIDTGRIDRWAYYFTQTDQFTLLGLAKSDPLDAHNIFVTLLFEAGVGALAMALIFAAHLFKPLFMAARRGTQAFGLSYLMMLATGPQLGFVILIAGGRGFPGWAEWSKLPLLVLAVLLVPALKAWAPAKPLPRGKVAQGPQQSRRE